MNVSACWPEEKVFIGRCFLNFPGGGKGFPSALSLCGYRRVAGAVAFYLVKVWTDSRLSLFPKKMKDFTNLCERSPLPST